MLKDFSIMRALTGYAPVQILQAVAAVGSVAVFTRILDVSEYGLYSLALAAVQLLQGSLFFWIHAAASRFTAPAILEGREPRLLATLFALFGLLVVVSAAATGLALLIWPHLAGLLLATLAGLVARSALVLLLEYHRSAAHVSRYAALDMTQVVLSLALGVWLGVAFGMGAAAPLWGLALANLLCFAVDAIRLLPTVVRARPELAFGREMASYGLPMMLASLAFRLSSLSDRFLIAYFVSEAAAGIYAVAFAAAERPLGMLFTWIGMSFAPAVIATFERDGSLAAGRSVARSAEAMILVGLPAGVGLALVAQPLLVLLAGPEYREQAAALLPWVAAAAVLRGVLGHGFPVIFAATKTNGRLAWVYTATALVNVVVNVLALPWLGLLGAAIGGVVTNVFGLLVAMVVARPLLPVLVPWRTLGWSGLGCVAMTAALSVLPALGPASDLLVQMMVGASVYGLVMLTANVAGCRDRLRKLR